LGSITSVGRCSRSASQATVAVLPVPVAPSSTVSLAPSLIRFSIAAMACGWSPAGTMSVMTSNGATRRCRSVTGEVKDTVPPQTVPPQAVSPQSEEELCAR
jgi:hypothetical protein